MKALRCVLIAPCVMMLGVVANPAAGQGTSFTYQGQLKDGGSAANGIYNITFAVFTTNVTGTAVAGPITNTAIADSNGLFTVTLDFGGGVFTGADS